MAEKFQTAVSVSFAPGQKGYLESFQFFNFSK